MNLAQLSTGAAVGLLCCGDSQGSCFLITYRERNYLVTDYHVLFRKRDNNPYADHVTVNFYTQESTINTVLRIMFKMSNVRKVSSPSSDLAIVEITDEANKFEYENGSSQDLYFLSLATPEYSQLWGSQVLILGHPTSLKKEVPFTLKPFLSAGIVSSYDIEAQKFIINIPAYYGNSGGPVLMINSEREVEVVGIIQNIIIFNLEWKNRYEQGMSRTDWHNSGYTICRDVLNIKSLIETLYQ